MKYTSEPWVLMLNQGEPYAILPAGRQGTICSFCAPFPKKEDIKRAISCVKACAGIPDPAEAIPALVEAAQGIFPANLSSDPQVWADAMDKLQAALAKMEVKP